MVASSLGDTRGHVRRDCALYCRNAGGPTINSNSRKYKQSDKLGTWRRNLISEEVISVHARKIYVVVELSSRIVSIILETVF